MGFRRMKMATNEEADALAMEIMLYISSVPEYNGLVLQNALFKLGYRPENNDDDDTYDDLGNTDREDVQLVGAEDSQSQP